MVPRKSKSKPASEPAREPRRISKRKKSEPDIESGAFHPEKPALQAPQGWLKCLGYLCSLFPPGGFALGVVYYSQLDPKAKCFGQNCMITAGLGLIALCFCWGILGLVKALGNAETTGLVGGYF
ncbi:hypothetical protein KAR34_09620 [bacterium]|nr:hypothetical protein [bacterium]